jgi:hypothetical protein
MTWNRFLLGVAYNPKMTKKGVCNQLGLKVGTINSIQKYNKLASPFYFKQPKAHKNNQIQKEKLKKALNPQSQIVQSSS